MLYGAGTDAGELIGAASLAGHDVNALLDDYSALFPDIASSDVRDRMFSVGTVQRIVPEVVFQIDGLSPLHLQRRLIPPTQDTP